MAAETPKFESGVLTIGARCKHEKIIVFGSRVLGNAKPGSDVGLAVIGQPVTPQIVSSFHDYLEEETNLPYFFDIIQFESIENEALREHIARYGKPLYVEKTFG